MTPVPTEPESEPEPAPVQEAEAENVKETPTKKVKKESSDKEAEKEKKKRSSPATRKESSVKDRTAADKKAARQKHTHASEKTASPVKSKSRPSAQREAKIHPEPIRLRSRLDSVKRTNATAERKAKAERTSVKGTKDKEEKQPTTAAAKSDDSTEKKTGQKFFQCVYVPGKGGPYPRSPFSPAMPVMMSPSFRSALEQQRAARASGQ